MDGRKLSPQLNLALEEQPNADECNLVVFVHAAKALAAKERESLRQLGIASPSADAKVFTATLSPKQVALLSSQKWVQAIRLSQTLRPKSKGES
jgi:hypothetical protein